MVVVWHQHKQACVVGLEWLSRVEESLMNICSHNRYREAHETEGKVQAFAAQGTRVQDIPELAAAKYFIPMSPMLGGRENTETEHAKTLQPALIGGFELWCVSVSN